MHKKVGLLLVFLAALSGCSSLRLSPAGSTVSVPNSPSFSIGTGTFSASLTVTISEASACATVYYTTDGSTPTAASAVYSSPISISKTTKLQAMAECPGGGSSAVSSATYTFSLSALNPPSFSIGTGTFSAPFTVTISEANSCATVYYTVNGNAPTAASAVYSSPISISKTTKLQAMAECPESGSSAVSSATYTFSLSALNPPSFSIGTGTFSAPFTVTISEASSCATVYYTTDGTTPTTASAVYSSPISISKTTTLQAIAECPESGSSAVSSANYTFSLSALNPPSFSIGTGTFSAPFSSDHQRSEHLRNGVLHDGWNHAHDGFSGVQQPHLDFQNHHAAGDSGVSGKWFKRGVFGNLHILVIGAQSSLVQYRDLGPTLRHLR